MCAVRALIGLAKADAKVFPLRTDYSGFRVSVVFTKCLLLDQPHCLQTPFFASVIGWADEGGTANAMTT